MRFSYLRMVEFDRKVLRSVLVYGAFGPHGVLPSSPELVLGELVNGAIAASDQNAGKVNYMRRHGVRETEFEIHLWNEFVGKTANSKLDSGVMQSLRALVKPNRKKGGPAGVPLYGEVEWLRPRDYDRSFGLSAYVFDEVDRYFANGTFSEDAKASVRKIGGEMQKFVREDLKRLGLA